MRCFIAFALVSEILLVCMYLYTKKIASDIYLQKRQISGNL